MNNSKQDKITGKVNVVKGNIKEKIGKLVGNPTLEAKGTVDKIKGHVQR